MVCLRQPSTRGGGVLLYKPACYEALLEETVRAFVVLEEGPYAFEVVGAGGGPVEFALEVDWLEQFTIGVGWKR
jgi:hypothetical protein